jgi:predicted DNA-binding transcriptional regulator YafY
VRRADRLLSLLELLRSSRLCTGQQLANALEVSLRTVYRDIAALIEIGVPIRGEAGVGYSLEHGYYLPPVSLTSEEAGALALGAHILQNWSDAPFAAQAKGALQKIRAVSPTESLRGLDSEILWAPQWVFRHAPAVDLLTLKRAAEHRQVLAIEYTALNGTKSRRAVRPLALTFFGQVWLLVAWCESRSDFRSFRVDRISLAERAGRTFKNEPGKCLADFKRLKGEQTSREGMSSESLPGEKS